jgi:hypothetical protein
MEDVTRNVRTCEMPDAGDLAGVRSSGEATVADFVAPPGAVWQGGGRDSHFQL